MAGAFGAVKLPENEAASQGVDPCGDADQARHAGIVVWMRMLFVCSHRLAPDDIEMETGAAARCVVFASVKKCITKVFDSMIALSLRTHTFSGHQAASVLLDV